MFFNISVKKDTGGFLVHPRGNLWADPSRLWVTETLYENANCERKSGILNKVT